MSERIERWEVNERESYEYTTTLKDAAGDEITLAQIDSLKLTLYNAADGTAINSRTAQDVLNTNNVTFHATSGLLTWSIQILDNIIVGSGVPIGQNEDHIALFEVVWDNETKAKRHQIVLSVRNLNKVPAE